MIKIDWQIIPKQPGVYLWKDKNDNVLYVGKAKNLRSRMKQYFSGTQNSYKTSYLVKNIANFDYLITKNDRDALILERNLIEKNHPKFNIKLTDDRHYPYLCINLNNNKLQITLIYRIKLQNSSKTIYYGPFPNGYGAKRIVNLLNRLYTFDKGLPIKSASLKIWTEKFNEIKKILTTKKHSLVDSLKKQMNKAASNYQFEIAHDIKETINAFKMFDANQTMTIDNFNNLDVIGFITKNNYLAITMLFYRQGNLLSKIDKMIEITSQKEDAIRQFISQYYNHNLKPDLIITNEFIETDNLKLIVPKRGTNHKILQLALNNASDNIDYKLSNFIRKTEITQNAWTELKSLLNLDNLNHILIVDNSHTNNTFPVSVILSYRNGNKVNYESRKYNLQVKNRYADVEYMKQSLTKHFFENKNPFPDLLIVDGGKAQINEIKKLFKNLKIIGLIKNKKHKTEFLIDQNYQKIKLENYRSLFNFLSKIQEEVDKYAKLFHHKKRQTTLEGFLKTIPGIGFVTEAKLLNHFKSYAKIYNASIEELSKIVSLRIAKSIKQKLGEYSND